MAETDEMKTRRPKSPEELRDDIAARRESISQIVGRLEDRVSDTVDWRKCVSNYPYATVGVAVGTGLLASM